MTLPSKGPAQPHGVERYLFVGDHTALPAIAQSLESLPDNSKAFIWRRRARD